MINEEEVEFSINYWKPNENWPGWEGIWYHHIYKGPREPGPSTIVVYVRDKNGWDYPILPPIPIDGNDLFHHRKESSAASFRHWVDSFVDSFQGQLKWIRGRAADEARKLNLHPAYVKNPLTPAKD